MKVVKSAKNDSLLLKTSLLLDFQMQLGAARGQNVEVIKSKLCDRKQTYGT